MLRLTTCFLITGLLLVVSGLPRADSLASLTRITNTPEHAINLNPTLSDDGRTVVFESTADLAGTGEGASFHALRADLAGTFFEIGSTRAVCPAVSGDGKVIVFASTEDLVGRNPDRNSEIFLFDGAKLNQLTETEPGSSVSRLSDGNFQPSITSDGRTIAYSSNGNIFLYDTAKQRSAQLTNESAGHAALNPKISADGARVYATDGADLLLIDTETGASRTVAAGLPDLSLSEGRAVSNDGMRVVFSASTGTNQTQVFKFDARDNSIRQITQLGSRATDVKLQPTISGDGKRIAFATRRRVTGASDGGVELYVFDLPSGQMQQITNAPAAATAEVTSSLNFDGSLVAFSFPRILSGPVSDDDFRSNSEIYLVAVAPRPVGVATIVNAAAQGHEPEPSKIAPGSIASIRGNALTLTIEAAKTTELPFTLAGTTVTINGQAAQLFYVSASEVVFVVPEELPNGSAEFLVTNADGLSSKAQAIIATSAPGVFTVAGDGRGEAIVLNSDTLLPRSFDPSNGELRLSIFVTGVSRSSNVSVTINGKIAAAETVAPARLLGLDEIHVLVPADLRGTGTCTLTMTADGVQSNPVSVVIGGKAPTPTPTPSPSPSPTPAPSPSPSPTPTPDASPHVVISQIFGGGGNSGAPFRNDFIEIFNAGSSTVNLNGWSVQYASATASTWSVTLLTSVTVAPGQYYLVQESSGGSNGAVLPAPDATGTIAMAAGSGKVALVKNSTALTGPCPVDANIADFLGYGSTANCFKGSGPAAAPSNTNALLRAANGCGAEFVPGVPNPRNTKSLPRICADQ